MRVNATTPYWDSIAGAFVNLHVYKRIKKMQLSQKSQIEISTFTESMILQPEGDTKMTTNGYSLAELFQIFQGPVSLFLEECISEGKKTKGFM